MLHPRRKSASILRPAYGLAIQIYEFDKRLSGYLLSDLDPQLQVEIQSACQSCPAQRLEADSSVKDKLLKQSLNVLSRLM